MNLHTLVGLIDILVVSYLVYRILALVRGTRAWRIVMGLIAFVLLLFLSKLLQLNSLHWVLEKATLLGPVALVILLLPELRQALEGIGRLGKLGSWSQRFVGIEELDIPLNARTVEELVAAASELSLSKTGALIVIEKTNSLEDIVNNGVRLDAHVSAPLLCSLFYGTNPLHDGAVIIRGDRVISAACRLPLSDNHKLAKNLHMRHRAGVGVSENFDCMVIVISEERGSISFVQEGAITPVNAQELREKLSEQFSHDLTRPTPKRERSAKRKEKVLEDRLANP